MCGQHCINTLLQGPYLSPDMLSEVALRLDAQEQVAMAEIGTETPEFIKFMAEESGNVAEDGNFSIQVMAEALKARHACFATTLVSLTLPSR